MAFGALIRDKRNSAKTRDGRFAKAANVAPGTPDTMALWTLAKPRVALLELTALNNQRVGLSAALDACESLGEKVGEKIGSRSPHFVATPSCPAGWWPG